MTGSWEPTGFAREIFASRHAAYPEEPWVDACKRVAWHVADAEQGPDRVRHFTAFREALVENRFMPGGRIWYGSGRSQGQLLNCFVIKTEDSREGWGKVLYDTVVIAGTGGGIGMNCSPIRPRGQPIRGTGGLATGAVSLMMGVNNVGGIIGNGGGRRIALMLCLSLSHGDIVEFLDKKLDLKELNNANISVVIDDDPERFFELVRSGADFPLTFQGKQVGNIPAAELWMRIVRNALKGGEPGLLNMYYANRMSNIWYVERLTSTNPCVTGDTLIAVADGRNAVSIRQLCDEGKDVPVYSVHPGTGKTEIKMGLNPRLTGEKAEVWKLTLDDGSVIRATPNHKFILSDMTVKELRDLTPGDSLLLKGKWKTSWDEMFPGSNSHSSDYWMVGGTERGNRFEHSLVAEHVMGIELQPGQVVHHRDFNSLNNSAGNLQVLSKEAHDSLHGDRMKGDRNPYHQMTDEWKQRFASHPGESNGMFGRKNSWGHHTEAARRAISEGNRGRKPSPETVEKISAARAAYYTKKHELDGTPQFLTKTCPNPDCQHQFTVAWAAREQTYCSRPCFIKVMTRRADVNEARRGHWRTKGDAKRKEWLRLYTQRRFELGRDLQKKEWEEYLRSCGLPWRFSNGTFGSLGELIEAANSFNHRVVSVEFDRYEDVYNVTVEDNHNFAIVLPDDAKTKSGKDRQNWVMTPQCGEIAMSPADSCCLGAVVLPRFVRDGEFDWDGFRETIRLGVRFLDDVLTVNSYPLPEIQAKCSQLRRIGLGVMGLHHMLIELGMRYSSAKGLEFVDRLLKFMKNESYEASIDLAAEKGPFPAFEAEKFLKSAFVKTLKPSIRERIREHGIRNCALNTIAPTGTTSMIAEVSSGVEPIFAMAYERRYRKGADLAMEVVADPLFRRYVQEGRSTKNFQNSYDLSARDHLEMQRTCQRHVDNAISKCIAAGTLVATDKGLMKIEDFSDVEGDDEFRDVSGMKTSFGEDITRHYRMGVGSATTIRLNNGAELTAATSTHRLMTTRGWVTMDEIRIGDRVIDRPSVSHGSGGAVIDFPDTFKTNARKISTPKVMSAELAEWLGMLASDGFIDGGITNLCWKDAPEVKERFFTLTQGLFDITPKFTVDRRNGVEGGTINSRNLVRYVHSLIGDRARTKHVPKQVLIGSADEKLAFLRGLTLDGCVTPRGLSVYSGISEDLAYEATELCRSFGIPGVKFSRVPYVISGEFVCGPIVPNRLQTMIDPIEPHKKLAPIGPQSYLVALDRSVLETRVPADHPHYSAVRALRQDVDRDYCKNTLAEAMGWSVETPVAIVTDIEDAGDVEMYDIEVAGSHSYRVNGMLSHNTINLPPGMTEEELSDLFMEFLPELKGVTVYPVGSREDQPLTPLSGEEAEQAVFDAIAKANGDTCRSGQCDI